MSITPSRRRWFRYSLRTFFVVLTIFCVWLGVQVKWIKARHEAIEWIKQQKATAFLEFRLLQSPPKNAPWGLRLLGEPGIAQIQIFVTRHQPPYRDEDAKYQKASDAAQSRFRDFKMQFPEADVTVSDAVREGCN